MSDNLISVQGDLWISAEDAAECVAENKEAVAALLQAWAGNDNFSEDSDLQLALCGLLHVESLLEPLISGPMQRAFITPECHRLTDAQVQEGLAWLPEHIELKTGEYRGYSAEVAGLQPGVVTAVELLLEWVQDWTRGEETARVFAHCYSRLRLGVHVWWLDNWGGDSGRSLVVEVYDEMRRANTGLLSRITDAYADDTDDDDDDDDDDADDDEAE